MDGLGKVQKLKKFMESHGCDFPEEADYGKRKNKQSKFISSLYRNYFFIFRQCSSRQSCTQ